jgi:hypothetical protein
LEKALQNKINEKDLKDRIYQLENDIFNKKHAITMAEQTLKNTRGLSESKIRENKARIANSKEMLKQMIKTLEYDREALANTNDTRIGMLQNERKWKMNALTDKIKDKLRNDPELNELTKEYNKLRFMIKTDNRFNTAGINDKPYSAEESIQERNQLAEQRVKQLNEEGEQD